jgi:tetratricopeptide (TPR) repeat protein
LGQSYEAAHEISKAELAYRQAMHLGMAEACVNLGAMLERQQQLEDARQQYEQCLPELAHATLYLNLGTLYYNTKVQKQQSDIQNILKGGEYWQQSFLLNPYDLDIHYNLGVYHLNTSKNFTQARYHFAACATKDRECASTLAEIPLINLNSERQHLDDLLKAKDSDRMWLLMRRAEYITGRSFSFDEPVDGMLFSMLEQGDEVIGVQVTAPGENIQNAAFLLNQLVYIDTYATVTTSTQSKFMAPLKAQEWRLFGQKHQIFEEKNGLWQYEIEF